VIKLKGTGLKKNTAGALAYVLGPITGVIFLILEKDPFVRFHAMQSIVGWVSFLVLNWFSTLLLLTIILAPLVIIFKGLLLVIGFVLLLMCIYKAWMGEEWEVPVLGKFARKLAKKA